MDESTNPNPIEPGQPVMKFEITGKGKTVALVPGGLTGWLSWQPHAELLGRKYQVMRTQLIAVDLGLSNAPLPDGYSVRYESTALANAMLQGGIDQADFVAWSYGAEITLDFALNNPDRVRTLTLIEPPAIWVLRSHGPLSPELIADQGKLAHLGPGDISEDQLAWYTHFTGLVPAEVVPQTLPQWPIWTQHRQSLRIQDLVFRHEDDIQRVREFHKPVFLIKGKGSAPFLHQIVDILGKEFPLAQIQMLAGGHSPHIAEMSSFMEMLDWSWMSS